MLKKITLFIILIFFGTVLSGCGFFGPVNRTPRDWGDYSPPEIPEINATGVELYVPKFNGLYIPNANELNAETLNEFTLFNEKVASFIYGEVFLQDDQTLLNISELTAEISIYTNSKLKVGLLNFEVDLIKQYVSLKTTISETALNTIFTTLITNLKTASFVGAGSVLVNGGDGYYAKPIIYSDSYSTVLTKKTTPAEQGSVAYYEKSYVDSNNNPIVELPARKWVGIAYEIKAIESTASVSAYLGGFYNIITTDAEENFGEMKYHYLYNSSSTNLLESNTKYGGNIVNYVNQIAEKTEYFTDEDFKKYKDEVDSRNEANKNNKEFRLDLSAENKNLTSNEQYPKIATNISANAVQLAASGRIKQLTGGNFVIEAQNSLSQILMLQFNFSDKNNTFKIREFYSINLMSVKPVEIPNY